MGRTPFRISSYRPISVVDSVVKLFELIFLSRFEVVLGNAGHDEQMGAEKGRNCPQQILCLLEAVGRSRRNGPVYAVYLDVVKAGTRPCSPLFGGMVFEGAPG
eukprot:Lithocolla_globosa_v1_NODE_278_length_4688_cov_20.187567.p6 type:complete len:103 gc:universal NODE_278_length_4688_cov_20.187567:1164-856(-)